MAAVLGGPDGRENLILGERATNVATYGGLAAFVIHFNRQHAGRVPNRFGDQRRAAFAGHAFDLDDATIHVVSLMPAEYPDMRASRRLD